MQVSSQLSAVPTPKPLAPPPTAPKPSLSFLPPPELQDRPPPAPWAEELRARTTLRQGGTSTAPAPGPAAPLGKGPTTVPKTAFTPSHPVSNFSPKPGNNVSSAAPQGVNVAPKITSHISFPPPPAAPPGPPPPPASVPAPAYTPARAPAPVHAAASSHAPSSGHAPSPAHAPAPSNAKNLLPVNQEKTSPPPASPQPKPAQSPTPTASPYGKPMASPTSSKVSLFSSRTCKKADFRSTV